MAEPGPPVRRAAFALGSNLGDRAATLQRAVLALAATDGLAVVAVSPVYQTDPVGGPADQPAYLNAVLVTDTVLSPRALLALAHVVEHAAGRERRVRWGPRTLDVDLLVVGDLTSDDPTLTLPHPRAHERAFVLVPWADVDPGCAVPGRGTVASLLAALPPRERAGVRRTVPALAAPGSGR
jgi:2-amino-4-hydroxy-6-hydroxymethyldihydropteridine diphosphokinase